MHALICGTALVAALVAVVAVAPSTAAREGGPDGFGYRFVDSREADGPNSQPATIAGDGAWQHWPLSELEDEIGGGPDKVGPLPIGFPFPFYGERYTEVYACPQGYLTFEESQPCSDPTQSGYSEVFTDEEPNNVIAPLWDSELDLNDLRYGPGVTLGSQQPGSFVVELTGTMECRRGQWNDPVRVAQVKLSPDGTIEFDYGQSDERTTCDHLIGIESRDGRYHLRHVLYTRDYGVLPDAIRFTPSCSGMQATPGAIPDQSPVCTDEVALSGDVIDGVDGHVCTVLQTGNVTCWGNSLDDWDRTDYTGGDAFAVDAAGDYTCAVVDSDGPSNTLFDITGDVQCWGDANPGPFENGDAVDVAVASGQDHEIGVGAWGTWWLNCVLYGIGNVDCPHAPGDDPDRYDYEGGDAIALDVGYTTLCVLTPAADVHCTDPDGDEDYSFRDGPSDRPVEVVVDEDGDGVCVRYEPTDLYDCKGGLRPVSDFATDIDAGHDRLCLTTPWGSVICDDRTPYDGLAGDVDHVPEAVAAGDDFECALFNDDNVTCWGQMDEDYLGGDAGRPDLVTLDEIEARP